jgi:hypothetical protein
MSSDPVADTVKTIKEFITDLRKNIFTKPDEEGDILLVEFFFGKMDPQALTNHVVKHVLPHSDAIEKRKVSFFIEKKEQIFGGLKKERVDYFASLVEKSESDGGLSDEDRAVIWSYFDVLVELSRQYKKNI